MVRTHPAFQKPILNARPTELMTAFGEQAANEECLNDHVNIFQIDSAMQCKETTAREGTGADGQPTGFVL